MSINAYTGLMGSGKSYEVVKSVVLPALKSGRRVISNIDGLNYEEIKKYVDKHGGDSSKLGKLVLVSDDDIKQPDFFLVDTSVIATLRENVVHPGDLVVIDEAWRYWSSSNNMPDSNVEFFRKHRHYTDPTTGVCCDLVVIVQDIMDLHKTLKNVVEMTFKTTKLKSLGLHSKYRIEFYEGTKLMRKNITGYKIHTYDKSIFPLYKSYGGGNGKEKKIDARQSLFANATLWYLLSFVVIGGGISYYGLKRFFLKEPAISQKELKKEGQVVNPSTGLSQNGQVPNSSSDFRIVGHINLGEDVVVLQDEAGKIRVEHPSNFKLSGISEFGELDGLKVFRYTYSTKGFLQPQTQPQK